jgi:RNA polymerase-interacting CarD/CdnL/TRCF family regulator
LPLVRRQQERQHAETSAELLSFGALAKSAKLGANVYEATAPRALCSQLQADLATIELPNEETYNEMCDQMKPQTAQLEKLAAAAAALRSKHHQALDQMMAARNSFEQQLQQLSLDSDAMQLEVGALSSQNDALRQQVRSVKQGEGVEAAMDALRESDERELSALSKQVNALQERLNSAKQEQARLTSADLEKGLHALTDVSTQLVEVGRKYTDCGMYAQALPTLHTALLCVSGLSPNAGHAAPLRCRVGALMVAHPSVRHAGRGGRWFDAQGGGPATRCARRVAHHPAARGGGHRAAQARLHCRQGGARP